MRILIDVLHPAHVHVFRNFSSEMKARGHEILYTARDKDGSIQLLESYGIAYRLLSRQARGTLGLAAELFGRTRRLIAVAREWEPDVLTGVMGPSIALAGRLLGVPAIIFYDTEFAWQTNWFAYPLAHSVCTPDCYEGAVRGRHVTYPGYHELAYLHPRRFAPDSRRLERFGVEPGERFTVVRFVSWEASHDIRERGLRLEQKRGLVERLLKHSRVLISSESPMPTDLERLRLRGPYEDIHHLIAHAALMVGESATMASEAVVLGVPAVYIADAGRGYITDQERRYGLVQHFDPGSYEAALTRIDELLHGDPAEARAARARLLGDKIDVTEWMVRYFEETAGLRRTGGV